MLFGDNVLPLSAPTSARALGEPTMGFVTIPSVCLMGMCWQQPWWGQMYQQAWLSAQAALAGPRPLKMRVKDLPRTCRN